MLKKLLLLIILVFTASVSLHADVAKPDIQAVCRVKLKNGKTIEGIVLIAKGGYQKYCDTNGFYVKHDSGEGILLLFDFDFQGIEFYEGVKYNTTGGYSKARNWFKNPKFYFLEDITFKKYHFDDTKAESEKEIESINADTLFILKKKITHQIEYKLLEYIPIYPELPKELYLRLEKFSVKPLKIYLKDIDKFEILVEPSEKWIQHISSLEESWIKAQEEPTGDSYPPAWFHQLIKEREKLEVLFKPLNF